MPSVLGGLAASIAAAASFLLLLASVARATTILASTFEGGVVIGTDSRTSQGSFVVNRLSDKIAPVYPAGIFLARSGNTADTQYVAGVVEAKLDAYKTQFGRDPTVRAAATVTRNLCYANKGGISASFICAGWDAREGSSVFVVDKGGTLLEQAFAIGGSGSPFAMGYCDLHLRPGLDRKECVMHVQKAIELAIGRDGSSGGVIRLCVVSAAGVERWTVTPTEQAEGGGGGGGAKIKTIKMMDRLRPSELLRVSLPFKELTLHNGDVVAKRGRGIVLHTRAEGRDGNVWLKCRSNQDRGALVDALVPWFEANSVTGAGELNVQQVPEGPLAAELRQSSVASFARSASGSVDVTRRKDTDCVIS